jgi:hypothetical protein
LDNFSGETPSGYFMRLKMVLKAATKTGVGLEILLHPNAKEIVGQRKQGRYFSCRYRMVLLKFLKLEIIKIQ